MDIPKLWQILFCLMIAFSYMWTTSALKCYVCTDCEGYYNSSHLLDCKTKEDKCIKLVLLSGVIDRTCGDKKKCFGRERRTRRSVSDIFFGSPKRRIARGLLPEPLQKEADGVKESSSIHCCNSDECNGSPSRVTFSSITTILPVLLTFVGYSFLSSVF